MKNRFQSLIIDGISYSRDELLGSVVPSLIHSGAEWKQHIGEFISQWLDETDAILVKTSGSTGEPKVISVSKEAMVLSAQKTIRFFLPGAPQPSFTLSARLLHRRPHDAGAGICGAVEPSFCAAQRFA